MQKPQRILSGHRVVPFEQTGAFFYRRARRHMDRSNYLGALGCLRKAVARDPSNHEYWLDMAETYTGMNCFDESNHILFSLAQSENHECFFGMGCNFLGMQEYDKARESFMTYIRLDPDGPYREDVEDLLDVLDEQSEASPQSTVSARVWHLAARGKQALDSNDAARAKRYLEKALQHEPSLLVARNNLALAFFCLKEIPRALVEGYKVLGRDPENLQAHCQLAMFHHAQGDDAAAREHVDFALAIEDPAPGDLSRICVMLCDLGLHKDAVNKLTKLRRHFTYDARTLHCLAAAYANCDDLPSAQRVWARISEIDPDDRIATWYQATAKRHMEEGTPFPASYHFQVPQEEILTRFRRINAHVQNGLLGMTEKWQSDTETRCLLLWGLTLPDPAIKRALLNLIASFRDETAERVLRMYLAKRDEPDAVKRDVFGMLKQMEAAEPYIAYLDNEVVEVRVSMLSGPLHLPPEYEHVLRIASREMTDRYGPDHGARLAAIFTGYLQKHEDRLPRIRRPEGWAAALEYVYCQETKTRARVSELCARYHTSPRTLRMIIAKLNDAQEQPIEHRGEE